MPDDFISRAEFESRHALLETRLSKLETDTDGLRSEMSQKFDKVLDKLDTLKDDVYRVRSANWRYVASVLVTFVIGIATPLAIQAMHVFK